jgi:hypothetical protein
MCQAHPLCCMQAATCSTRRSRCALVVRANSLQGTVTVSVDKPLGVRLAQSEAAGGGCVVTVCWRSMYLGHQMHIVQPSVHAGCQWQRSKGWNQEG